MHFCLFLYFTLAFLVLQTVLIIAITRYDSRKIYVITNKAMDDTVITSIHYWMVVVPGAIICAQENEEREMWENITAFKWNFSVLYVEKKVCQTKALLPLYTLFLLDMKHSKIQMRWTIAVCCRHRRLPLLSVTSNIAFVCRKAWDRICTTRKRIL